ncbi:MAG: hypothetical protein ACI8X3_001803 [Saprospiraceae bacterium]|jgi:hypothetical protein
MDTTKMTNPTHQISQMAYARLAGLLYLLIAISGGFSIGYMPSVIIAPGDAIATAQNIAKHQGLFRLGILGDIAVFLMEIALTVMLYRMFKSISPTLSMIAAFSRMAMGIVMGLNLFNYLIPINLMSGADYLSAFEPDQLQTLAMLFLDAHQDGVYIWGLFFALHLIALGYLIFKSGFFPKALGVLMMIGSFGYGGESIAAFTFPDNATISIVVTVLLVLAVIGELGFTFYLLIKGQAFKGNKKDKNK